MQNLHGEVQQTNKQTGFLGREGREFSEFALIARLEDAEVLNLPNDVAETGVAAESHSQHSDQHNHGEV